MGRSENGCREGRFLSNKIRPEASEAVGKKSGFYLVFPIHYLTVRDLRTVTSCDRLVAVATDSMGRPPPPTGGRAECS